MAVTEIIKGKKYIIQRGTENHGFEVGAEVTAIVGAGRRESFAIAEDKKGHQGFIIKTDVELKK